MLQNNYDQEEINKLINSAWESGLRKKFEECLLQLGISKNQAVENLEISTRTLDGILDGTLKQTDFLSLLKVAQFLEISFDEITMLYVQSITRKHKNDLEQSAKRSFIINNFDLPALKSVGIINSIRDLDHIEQKINEIFDLTAITEFDIEDTGAAFSSGKKMPKNLNNRRYFIAEAKSIFKLINNPNKYDKDAVVEYFKNIKWQSLDVEYGLLKVIQSLYSLGITVIFRSKMPKLQMRGATFAVNDKPCIVLTDYRGLYPTLFFALLHELFHVLFDWEEILQKKYHLSDEGNDIFLMNHKEEEANEFASDFMIPKNKIAVIDSHISERLFIKEFALENYIHPSIVYANYAFRNSNEHENYWIIFKDFFPSFKSLLKRLGSGFEHTTKVKEIASFYKNNIFNEK